MSEGMVRTVVKMCSMSRSAVGRLLSQVASFVEAGMQILFSHKDKCVNNGGSHLEKQVWCKGLRLVEESGRMSVWESLYEFQRANVFCDISFRLEDGSVHHGHKIIFCTQKFFRSLLFLNSDCREFELPVLKAGTMHAVVQFLYLHAVEVDGSNVWSLLTAADFLCMDGLLDLCSAFLRRSLSSTNCIGIMLFARSTFCKELEKYARRWILTNFEQVYMKSQEFLKLSDTELRDLLASDELNTSDELLVWHSVLRWTQYDKNKRQKHIVSLLGTIRLALIDKEMLVYEILRHPLVVNNEECRALLANVFDFAYNMGASPKVNVDHPLPDIAMPRIPYEVLFVFGGGEGQDFVNVVETYNTRTDEWTEVDVSDSECPRAYYGVAVTGFLIFVIGGTDGFDSLSTCRCFNSLNMTWSEVAPMRERRCYVSAAVLNNFVYAIGGFDGISQLASVERFDSRQNQWNPIADLRDKRACGSAASLNDRIYMAGGYNGLEQLSTVEVYDPELDQWTFIKPMWSRRSGLCCTAHDGSIYVIGGFNGHSELKSGERYIPEKNSWVPIPEMFHARTNFAVGIVDGLIFAIGGFNGLESVREVESFQPTTLEWFATSSMNFSRSAISACVIGGLPNVKGYIKHPQRLSNEIKPQPFRTLKAKESQNDIIQSEEELLKNYFDTEENATKLNQIENIKIEIHESKRIFHIYPERIMDEVVAEVQKALELNEIVGEHLEQNNLIMSDTESNEQDYGSERNFLIEAEQLINLFQVPQDDRLVWLDDFVDEIEQHRHDYEMDISSFQEQILMEDQVENESMMENFTYIDSEEEILSILQWSDEN